MTWAQVDAFKEALAHPVGVAKGATEWRAFAKIDVSLWGKLRFRCKPATPRRIKVEVPCSFVPGKWRATGGAYIDVRELIRHAEAEEKRHGAKALLTVARAKAVLVAHDKWLEAGAPRMSRPTVIP